MSQCQSDLTKVAEYILHSKTYDGEQAPYIGYGITVQGDNGEMIAVLPDISRDQNEVVHLIELCNTLVLDPIHLADVVDDFLG